MFDQQVIFLYTGDLEASARFYGQTLGLALVLDQGACRIFRTSPNGFIGLCQCREGRPSHPDGVIVTLVSDDVDGWYDRLSARGVVFETAPSRNEEFNIYHCFLRDPDGHQIEIQRFLDANWPVPAQ